MRIISGSARGRKLAEFSGSGIRPTSDRVREAIFSILLSRFNSLRDFRVLELCAGSGALSLEALSRGAQSALLVDSSTQAASLIADNIARCKMADRAGFLKQSAEAGLKIAVNKGPFELIFMDPPYNQGLIPQLLTRISALQLLTQNGIICAESASGEQFELPPTLELLETRRYGSSEVHFICNLSQQND
jgi:16S rRNA (guanine(966)-N(2))-methyltransferase RsmD